MNVAFDSWIPVVTETGERKLVSLCDVLTDGKRFADLAVRPHERVSLMRLFLCVVHAALDGPKDYDEWLEVPKRLSDASRKYLEKWKDSFELFHPTKPWLQVAELKGTEKDDGDTGKDSPVALLDFELATGNNSTLNDHSGQLRERLISHERTALNLLTFQNFSSGGGSPVAQWKSVKTTQVGNPDAPCLSQSMAHCLIRGDSVIDTIWFNLPHFEAVGMTYRCYASDKKHGASYVDVDVGRPVWELFPKSPEPNSIAAINATKTYMGRLVPVCRWIRLLPDTDRMYCCNGFKYDTYKDGFAAEPTAAVRIVKKKDPKGAETSERRIMSLRPMRSVWRELSSLLVKRHADDLGGPLAMEMVPYDTAFDFHVCAMIRDQASMDITVESVFHINPKLRSGVPTYREEVERAEGIANLLRRSVETYRNSVDVDWKEKVSRTQAKEQIALKERLAQTALLSYWTAVEKYLPLLLAHINAIGTDEAEPTLNAWRRMIFAAACEAYRVACGQETPRQMKAFAKGWQKLTSRKGEAETDSPEDKEDDNELAS